MIRIRFFGALRDWAGVSEMDFPLVTPVAAREVKAALSEKLLKAHGESGRELLLDSALANETRILSDRDLIEAGHVIAVLPPVCGG